MNVFRLREKSRAFVIGCVAGAMSLSFTGAALGNAAIDELVQLPPANGQDIADVITVVTGGGEFQKAIEVSPFPYREYGAWLGELWSGMFATPWEIEKSYLTFPELTEIPQGNHWSGQSSHGELVSYYIEDIIDLIPTVENGAEPEDLLALEMANANLKIIYGNLYTDTSSRNGVASLVLSGDTGLGDRISVVFPLTDYEFGVTVIPGGSTISAPAPDNGSSNTGFGGVSNFDAEQRRDCEDPPCISDLKNQLEEDLRDAYVNFKGNHNATNGEAIAGSAAGAGAGALGATGGTLAGFALGAGSLVAGVFLLVGLVAYHSKNNIDIYRETRDNIWDDFYDDMRELCGTEPAGSYMAAYNHCYGGGQR